VKDWVAWLEASWPWLAAAIALGASGHAVLNKREVRSAGAWVALILLLPGLGALLYVLIGVNRIRRVAHRVRAGIEHYDHESPKHISAAALPTWLAVDDAHLSGIARTIERTSGWPLLSGNRSTILSDGDEAYPAMLDAIASAKRSIALCSYIFDNDPTGRRFVDALAEAHRRGVAVRVLIDDAGARYSFPSVERPLRARGVTVARFLRVLAPWSAAFINLRNHRKVLIVDGGVGFTGGMNIRHACMLSAKPKGPTRDLHFRFDGPIAADLMAAFAEDWTFTTGETLAGDLWFPELSPAGDTILRVISDGPDRDLDCMRWALHGAIGSARRSVRVLTPYFLPDEPLIRALNGAALRGVQVDIVLPARGNLRLVDWAMRGELWKVLHHGCRVWLSPPPFDHSKLLTVDGAWALVGSANWDPRSLRLNFELGVECYDRAFVTKLDALVARRIQRATHYDAAMARAVPLPVRLRDGVARLLSPYL
jgi:cardiolipin synthase